MREQSKDVIVDNPPVQLLAWIGVFIMLALLFAALDGCGGNEIIVEEDPTPVVNASIEGAYSTEETGERSASATVELEYGPLQADFVIGVEDVQGQGLTITAEIIGTYPPLIKLTASIEWVVSERVATVCLGFGDTFRWCTEVSGETFSSPSNAVPEGSM
jgi:hypothetical protein